MNPTKAELEKAKEWKEIADKYNLSIGEMYELAAYVVNIKNILNK